MFGKRLGAYACHNTSLSENLQCRKLNVENELKHGFGDYVHLPVDTVNNSSRPRTQGGIALMSSDNLEGSWYYMLLDNWSIVKRTLLAYR
jgi:hypothetical protein